MRICFRAFTEISSRQLSETQDVKLQEILEKLSQIDVATGEALKTTTIHITNRLNQTDSNVKRMFAQSERTASKRHNQAMGKAQRRHEESEAKAKADKFLQTLFFPEILERRSQIKDAAPGTLKWIFETEDMDVSGKDLKSHPGVTQRRWDNLAAWLRNDNGVYWVNGKAGSGKSTLMAHILGDTRTKKALDVWCGGQNCHILSYFFWRAGTVMQKSVLGLLRSLLYQVCAEKPKQTLALMNRLAIGTSTMHIWTEKLLKKAFHEAINIATRSQFCIFVDGLDEFDGNHAELVDLIFELQGHERVKFCVSSRPEVQLSKRLTSCRTVRLQDLNLSDIARFTKLKLTKAGIDIDTEHGPLHHQIAGRAEGVFLWAVLVTDSLVRGIEAGDDQTILSKRIETMPQGLNDLFKSMLNKVEKVHQESLAFYLHALSIRARNDSLISIANLTASKVPSALSSLESFEIACQQTESQVLAQGAGLMEIGTSWAGRYFDEDDWEPEQAWLKAKDPKAPFTRERQTDVVKYPATLIYEAKAVKWVHRSAYDFVWDQDNADVLNISQTTPEDVLHKLYRGYLALFIYSPSCSLPRGSLTEKRLWLSIMNIKELWNSYTSVTRKATENMRLALAEMDFREMTSASQKHGSLENLSPDWVFWTFCIEERYWSYILENIDILPISTYGLVIREMLWRTPPYALEEIHQNVRDSIVNIFNKSFKGCHIHLLWAVERRRLSISYNSWSDRTESPISLASEKCLAASVAKALFEYGCLKNAKQMTYLHEIVNRSGLFIEVANGSPHLYMQASASSFLKQRKWGDAYTHLRADTFRIICFPSGKTSPLSDDHVFETDRFVYFDTTPDTTNQISHYLRQLGVSVSRNDSIILIATIDNVGSCRQKIIDDFRANEQQLEATEKIRVVECLEAHLWDMLMSIRKEPVPQDNESVSSYSDSDLEGESAVSEDYKDQTGGQETQLFDETRSNRMVREEDSSEWLTDDGDSTASSEEAS